MRFTLIENGEVYAPDPLGRQPVLLLDSKIVAVGQGNAQAVQAVGIPFEVIDASGCFVVPGVIDPHAHLLGAGGEHGFDSRMPEIKSADIVQAGITTVVGLLGTDTTTRHLTSLHSKASQLSAEGISSFMFTGGFQLPAQTLTDSLRNDLILIDKVIGVGEIALSDYRWVDPELHVLAHVVAESMLGGMMAGKAGVTHFHLGEGKKRLALVRALLEEHEFPAECLYITHITRTPELFEEAIELARQQGVYVDTDTVEPDTAKQVRYYLEHNGPADHLTLSSDAQTPGGSPKKLYEQWTKCVLEEGLALETVLPMLTRNTAQVLKLPTKGSLAAGKDADVLVLKQDTLEVKHVFAMGRQFIRNGQRIVQSKEEQQMEQSYQ